jgi:hypothetical protein
LAEEAVSAAEATEWRVVQVDALLSLGEVITLAGRPDDALEPTRRALALAEAKEYTVGADRARALLARLAVPA